MSLEAFFRDIGPYLLGQRGHDETIKRLYGDAPPQPDADRLRIYARFCRIHRDEALEPVFSYCHDAIEKLVGEDGWKRLISRYFDAHPMHHFTLGQNGIHFPPFVAALVETGELPGFLAELADFEWWELLTDMRLDETSDADGSHGALRLHSSVDLRPYKHDLITWIDDDERESAAPELRDNVVLFYRDRELQRQRQRASGLHMLIIKAVVEETPLDDNLAAMLGVPAQMLQDAVAELRECGVLLGAR